MSTHRSFLLGAMVLLIAACDFASGPGDGSNVIVRPQDFALLPCHSLSETPPCTLAIVGGKRILFGAPAGVGWTLPKDDLRQLDAVVLFALDADAIEGLDEVRNQSWREGRAAALRVIGPTGVVEMVTALNNAMEQSDALFVVKNGVPPGGYNAALLEPIEAPQDSRVFDTGDVVIFRRAAGYQIDYSGRATALLEVCGTMPDAPATGSELIADVRIGCRQQDGADTWPISAPIFVLRG
ncbi:MAG: hypothetical protein AAGH49_08940 [Pseudomonadota bacterium]